MSGRISYPWAILYGFYYYVLFQLIFLVRFGNLNLSLSALDLGLIVVGIASVLLCMYFSRRATRRWMVYGAFMVALPFSLVGALGGGLLGFFGILVFGLAPFLVAIPLGYWLGKARPTTVSAESTTPTNPPQA